MKKASTGTLLRILALALCPMVVPAQALEAGATVVLAGFENRTGQAVFDGTLHEAVAEELEVSPFLSVLSDQKVADGLRRMGRAEDALTVGAGRRICLADGGKAVVSARISRPGSAGYTLDLSAVDCRSGNTLAQVRIVATQREDVLGALSLASSRLRAKLGEPASSIRRYEIPVDATTSSLQALKDYGIAIRMARENGGPPTIPLLEEAIRLDPDFALAYAALSPIYGNLRQPGLALQCATRAYRLRDRVGERERLRISATYFLASGRLQSEMRTYALWQAEYPRDFLPYNNLGNDYAAIGRLQEALAQYQKGLDLQPTLIGYVNVGGMDLNLDRLDDAKRAYDEALAHHFDGRYLRQNIYWLAFLRRDATIMRQQLAWASANPADEDALLSEQSDTEAYHGRMRSAQEFTQRAVSAAIKTGSRETGALWQVNAALREAEVGNFALARQGVASALALSSGRDVTLMAAFTLARSGATSQANALLAKLEKEYPTDAMMKLYWLPTIRAAVALDEGDHARAVDELQAAASHELGGAATFVNYLYPAYVRGQAYLLAHQGNAAAAEFQKLLDHRGIVLNFVTGALAHLETGRAYALAGDEAKARAAYRQFLALWHGADADVPVLEQAKAEYARLR